MIVRDNALPLKHYLLKPYSQIGLTKQKRIYDYRLSHARRMVENTFGILANRFRIFMKPIALSPEKVKKKFLHAVLYTTFCMSDSNLVASTCHEVAWIQRTARLTISHKGNGTKTQP